MARSLSFGRRLPLAVLTFATLQWVSCARADVLAIGDDGTLTLHSGPALYLSSDMRPAPLPALPDRRAARPRTHRDRPASEGVLRDIDASSARFDVSSDLVRAVAQQESAFRATARSTRGALGIMQLMPETARQYCEAGCSSSQNVAAGTAYLHDLLERYQGDIVKALAAYNAGPRAVDRFGGVPPYPETRDYVDAIFARMSADALSEPVAGGR